MSAVPPSIPPQRNSGLAVASLVCGVLTMVCLGPLGALPAIILGHCALSSIKKSGGAVGGKGMAVGGLVMGYFFLVILLPIIAAIALPNFVKARERAQVTRVKLEERVILTAIVQYQSEYGKFPSSLGDGKEVTLGADNNRLFDILRARPGTEKENPRQVQFLGGNVSKSTPPTDGLGADGVFYDYWGRPFQIRLNLEGGNSTTNPYTTNAGENPVQEAAIVWSLGADGQLGRAGDGDAKADPVSWQ